MADAPLPSICMPNATVLAIDHVTFTENSAAVTGPTLTFITPLILSVAVPRQRLRARQLFASTAGFCSNVQTTWRGPANVKVLSGHRLPLSAPFPPRPPRPPINSNSRFGLSGIRRSRQRSPPALFDRLRKTAPDGSSQPRRRFQAQALNGDGVSRCAVSIVGTSVACPQQRSMNDAFSNWPCSSYPSASKNALAMPCATPPWILSFDKHAD